MLGYVINPARENQKGIGAEYYQRMIAGKTHGWINVYVCNQYGTLTDGKPVYPTFDGRFMCSSHRCPFPATTSSSASTSGLPPPRCSGRRSAAAGSSCARSSPLTWASCALPAAARNMAELGGNYSMWGDPTGDNRVGTDEDTPFRVLKRGLQIRPTPTNDPALRIEAVTMPLERLVDKPPAC